MISQLQKYTPGQAQPLTILAPARGGRIHFVRFHDVTGAQRGAPDDSIYLRWSPAWALDCEADPRPKRASSRPPEDIQRNVPLRGRWSPTFTVDGSKSLPAATYDLDLAPIWAPTAGSIDLCGGIAAGDPDAMLYVSVEHRPLGIGEEPPRRVRTLWGAAGAPVLCPRGAYMVSTPDAAAITITYPALGLAPAQTRSFTLSPGVPQRINGAGSVTRTGGAGPLAFEIGL